MVGTEIGFGASDEDFPADWLAMSEEEQWEQLSASWSRVCTWAEGQQVSRIEVSQFPRRAEQFLRELGVRLEGESGIIGRLLAGEDSTQFGKFQGDPHAVADIMRRLHEIPSLDLEVFAGDCQRVQLVDMSWDAVILYCHERPTL